MLPSSAIAPERAAELAALVAIAMLSAGDMSVAGVVSCTVRQPGYFNRSA